MAKRDLLDEILSKRQRLTDGEFRAASGLLQIDASINRGPLDDVTTALHVVGIVACIEVAVREAIRKLIDSGAPYDDRVDELLKTDMRFTLDVARAFHARKISLGEFVSHLLPISNLSHVVGYLDVLVGSPILGVLAKVADDAYETGDHAQNTPIIADVDNMMRSLASAFALRHVAAHEAGFAASQSELRNILANAILFDRALFQFVRQEAGPGATPSALRDSLAALAEANEIESQMRATYEKLHVILTSGEYDIARSDAGELLAASQDAFDRHLEAEVSFHLALYNPGSGNSMRSIEAMVTHRLCAQRTEWLDDAVDTTIGWLEQTKLRSGA